MAPVKKKKENVRNLRYPDTSMQSAIKAVREGRFKLREAGRHYGVPHNTLSNKLKGVVPEARKMGRATYLSDGEEKLLVSYIIANAKKGIPLKRQTLVETVKKKIDEDGRETPFACNRPGRKWVDLFLKRHPQLCEKKAEGISTARANVSEADLRQWSESLKQYLTNEQALEILDDPKRIYNADESGFQTCPESGRVLGPVGMKNFFEVKSGKEKEQLTVMACINAAGQIVAPMVVYPLVRISKDISCNVPTNWSIGKSPKGWMTAPLFYEYIANVYDPWLKYQNIKKPVLLLVDGHRSHMTMQVSEYCSENQILTHALYPNSTHITQPADVSLFKCLKSGWQNTVFEYKQSTGNKHITRAGFAPLLSKVFQDKVTPEIIANGFKRCGIYPFDPSAVDYSKCMDNKVRKVLPSAAEVGVETVLLLESFMRRGRVEQFRRSENEDWQGDESAKELFYVWKKFRRHCSQEKVADDEMDKEVAQNMTHELKEQASFSPSHDYIPLSPSITKTPPRASVTDSTRRRSVESPETNHRDPKLKSFLSGNRHCSQEKVAVDEIRKQVAENTTLELNEEASSSSIQDNIPLSPSIIKTPPRASVMDSTRRRSVTYHPDHISKSFMARNQQCSQEKGADVQEASSPSQDYISLSHSILKTPTSVTDSTRRSSVTSPETNNPDLKSQSFISRTKGACSSVNKSFTAKTIDGTNITPNTKLIQIMALKQKQISPAFGNHILWPSDSPIKKHTKERLPLAVSSSAFRDYFQQKENEKERKIEEVQRRKRKREEIRNNKIQKASKAKNSKESSGNKFISRRASTNKTKSRRQVLKSDSETESDEEKETEQDGREESEETSSTDSENIPLSRTSASTKQLCQGDYVIIKYEGEYFPGVVENVDQHCFEISTMTFSTGNAFRWPEKQDKIWYSEKDIVECIESPVLTNKRGFYLVKEMTKFLPFTV